MVIRPQFIRNNGRGQRCPLKLGSGIGSLTANSKARRRRVAPRRQLNLEHLEDRTVPTTTAYHFDMGPPGSPLATGYPGYRAVSAATDYTAARGDGWIAGVDLQNWQRPIGTPLTRDFVQAPDETFAVDVRDGTYTVLLTVGNANVARNITVYVEGQQVGTVTTAANQAKSLQYTAQVTDGQLTVRVAGQNNASVPIDGLNVFAGSNSLLGTGILPVRATSAPAAAFVSSGPVNEGGTGSVSLANVSGGVGPYTFSYGFGNSGATRCHQQHSIDDYNSCPILGRINRYGRPRNCDRQHGRFQRIHDNRRGQRPAPGGESGHGGPDRC